jgi:hypothetical protein
VLARVRLQAGPGGAATPSGSRARQIWKAFAAGDDRGHLFRREADAATELGERQRPLLDPRGGWSIRGGGPRALHARDRRGSCGGEPHVRARRSSGTRPGGIGLGRRSGSGIDVRGVRAGNVSAHHLRAETCMGCIPSAAARETFTFVFCHPLIAAFRRRGPAATSADLSSERERADPTASRPSRTSPARRGTRSSGRRPVCWMESVAVPSGELDRLRAAPAALQ